LIKIPRYILSSLASEAALRILTHRQGVLNVLLLQSEPQSRTKLKAT
jgi:hypothetical protein